MKEQDDSEQYSEEKVAGFVETRIKQLDPGKNEGADPADHAYQF